MAIRSTPDQATRTALNKIKLGGLGGQLTPEDQRRISAFEFIEKENARVDAEKNDLYRSYATQSARQPSVFNAEASADNLLNSMFGQRQPGQISIAPSTPKAFTQGMKTPRGNILGQQEAVTIGDSLNPVEPPAGAMQPSMDMGAAPPQPVSARGTILGQAPTAYSQPPIQASILGDKSSVLDKAIADSPQGRQAKLQLEKFQFQKQQYEKKVADTNTEKLIENVADRLVVGDSEAIKLLPPDLVAAAMNRASAKSKDLITPPSFETPEQAFEAGAKANPNAEIFVTPSSGGNFTFDARKKTPDQRPLRPTSIEEKGNAISEARKLFAAGNRTAAADKLNSIGQFLTNNLGERLVITGKTVSQFFEDEEDLSDDDLVNLYLPKTPGNK
jgi:hypothetical protein